MNTERGSSRSRDNSCSMLKNVLQYTSCHKTKSVNMSIDMCIELASHNSTVCPSMLMYGILCMSMKSRMCVYGMSVHVYACLCMSMKWTMCVCKRNTWHVFHCTTGAQCDTWPSCWAVLATTVSSHNTTNYTIARMTYQHCASMLHLVAQFVNSGKPSV